MFLGTFDHTIDERNRLMLPKKFRMDLKNQAVITRGLDGCLFLYTFDSWKKIEKKLVETPLTNKDARNFARHMLSGAMEVDIDKFGRILLPGYLKDYANLKTNIVVLGMGERLEIWDKKKWESYSENMEEKTSELAERLSTLGI